MTMSLVANARLHRDEPRVKQAALKLADNRLVMTVVAVLHLALKVPTMSQLE